MEKPEWFETVDALDEASESVTPSSAHAHSSRISRFTKFFVALGVAALFAGGGFAFGQLSSASSSSDALASSNTPTAAAQTQSPSTSAAAPSPAATTAAGTSATPSIAGGRPSITGAGPAGEVGND
jgi:hypothetical protein